VGGLGREKNTFVQVFSFCRKNSNATTPNEQKKAGFVFVFWYVIKQIERRKLQATKMHFYKD